MERKEAIRGAYRMTGGNNFYDGMITCSTLSGKAVCRLVWAMNKAENDAYLEKAMSGIPEHFSGKLREVPVGTGILSGNTQITAASALALSLGIDIQNFPEGAIISMPLRAEGERKGAVGMVHLYSPEVQGRCVKLGLTTHKKIKHTALIFKAVCVPGYIAYVLVCVYALNGAKGFVQGFWQLLVILSVMNLIDRFWVDGYWVGHTNAWEIPGTEDLKPYITAKDKGKKWLFGTIGMAVISAALAAIVSVFIH